jgi:hypothetical protein
MGRYQYKGKSQALHMPIPFRSELSIKVDGLRVSPRMNELVIALGNAVADETNASIGQCRLNPAGMHALGSYLPRTAT